MGVRAMLASDNVACETCGGYLCDINPTQYSGSVPGWIALQLAIRMREKGVEQNASRIATCSEPWNERIVEHTSTRRRSPGNQCRKPTPEASRAKRESGAEIKRKSRGKQRQEEDDKLQRS